MAASRRMFALAFVCLAGFAVARVSDQLAAARVLGPQWRQISRSAEMVFAGTVLGVERLPFGKGRPIPLILIKFRVDRAIAGVQTGQELNVREWAGAWSTHRAMWSGQRFLIFLYPRSRLGLTSPVGGPLGQVVLDSRGEIKVPNNLPDQFSKQTSAAEAVVNFAGLVARVNSCPSQNQLRTQNQLPPGVFPQATKRSATQHPTLLADCSAATEARITLRQLERAIRSARKK